MSQKNKNYSAPAVIVSAFVPRQIATTSRYYNNSFEDIYLPKEQTDW